METWVRSESEAVAQNGRVKCFFVFCFFEVLVFLAIFPGPFSSRRQQSEQGNGISELGDFGALGFSRNLGGKEDQSASLSAYVQDQHPFHGFARLCQIS